MGFARSILVLSRLSNLPTVFANVLAAWFLGGGTWSSSLAAAALAAALCYTGGMIVNDVCDAEWDRRFGKPRPIPRGEISRNTAGWLGWGSLGLGGGGLLALGANPLWATGLLTAIVLYNGLHKRWPGSVWLMGACRFFLFVSVASLPAAVVPLQVWLWGTALALYVVGITLAARREDTSQQVAPAAFGLLAMPAVCGAGSLFSLVPTTPLAWPVLFLTVFCLWTGQALGLFVTGKQPVGRLVGRLLAGMVLIDAMALSSVRLDAALLCFGFLLLNLLLQTVIPPT